MDYLYFYNRDTIHGTLIMLQYCLSTMRNEDADVITGITLQAIAGI